MKIKFFIGISVAVIVGIFFASGVLYTGSYVYKYIKTKSYALYETANDLGSSENYEIEDEETEYIIDSLKNLKSSYNLFNNSKRFPNVTSRVYLVIDLDTSEIIKQQNIDEIYPIASLTKLMTSVTSLETLNQDKETRVSYSAIDTYGKQGSLYSGQNISVSELLYPLILESSNDAAEVLAEASGRKFFIGNMNGKVRSIGLANTEFADPSGLSRNNVSTARELFRLVSYIDKNHPEILEISKTKTYEGKENTWFNNSKFRNEERYLGGKNGYTDEALHTLISIFELPLTEFTQVSNNNQPLDPNRRIAIILLQGIETEDDTRAIVSWLLDNVYYQ
jgi:D-alanyl-D-alanine endopeptidase (penicillin-binding protein 7)